VITDYNNLSVYLSDTLDYDYTYMSNLFSETLGVTIEKFFICHKIERAKELLKRAELSLTEIAYKLHYSSVAHLSGQFKKVAGITPSEFKHLSRGQRNLDDNCCQ
jgi:AraC-like DNA-binding protein